MGILDADIGEIEQTPTLPIEQILNQFTVSIEQILNQFTLPIEQFTIPIEQILNQFTVPLLEEKGFRTRGGKHVHKRHR